MNSLYHINEELLQLLKDREDIDDEQAFKDTWEALAWERRDKIENILSFIKSLHTWADGCEKEAKTLKERAARYRKKAENITSYLQSQLEPREEYVSDKHEIKWRASTQTVVTVPPEELPERFRKVSYTASKKDIREYLNEGGTIQGCSLNKQLNLSIK